MAAADQKLQAWPTESDASFASETPMTALLDAVRNSDGNSDISEVEAIAQKYIRMTPLSKMSPERIDTYLGELLSALRFYKRDVANVEKQCKSALVVVQEEVKHNPVSGGIIQLNTPSLWKIPNAHNLSISASTSESQEWKNLSELKSLLGLDASGKTFGQKLAQAQDDPTGRIAGELAHTIQLYTEAKFSESGDENPITSIVQDIHIYPGSLRVFMQYLEDPNNAVWRSLRSSGESGMKAFGVLAEVYGTLQSKGFSKTIVGDAEKFNKAYLLYDRFAIHTNTKEIEQIQQLLVAPGDVNIDPKDIGAYAEYLSIFEMHPNGAIYQIRQKIVENPKNLNAFLSLWDPKNTSSPIRKIFAGSGMEAWMFGVRDEFIQAGRIIQNDKDEYIASEESVKNIAEQNTDDKFKRILWSTQAMASNVYGWMLNFQTKIVNKSLSESDQMQLIAYQEDFKKLGEYMAKTLSTIGRWVAFMKDGAVISDFEKRSTAITEMSKKLSNLQTTGYSSNGISEILSDFQRVFGFKGAMVQLKTEKLSVRAFFDEYSGRKELDGTKVTLCLRAIKQAYWKVDEQSLRAEWGGDYDRLMLYFAKPEIRKQLAQYFSPLKEKDKLFMEFSASVKKLSTESENRLGTLEKFLMTQIDKSPTLSEFFKKGERKQEFKSILKEDKDAEDKFKDVAAFLKKEGMEPGSPAWNEFSKIYAAIAKYLKGNSDPSRQIGDSETFGILFSAESRLDRHEKTRILELWKLNQLELMVDEKSSRELAGLIKKSGFLDATENESTQHKENRERLTRLMGRLQIADYRAMANAQEAIGKNPELLKDTRKVFQEARTLAIGQEAKESISGLEGDAATIGRMLQNTPSALTELTHDRSPASLEKFNRSVQEFKMNQDYDSHLGYPAKSDSALKGITLENAIYDSNIPTTKVVDSLFRSEQSITAPGLTIEAKGGAIQLKNAEGITSYSQKEAVQLIEAFRILSSMNAEFLSAALPDILTHMASQGWEAFGYMSMTGKDGVSLVLEIRKLLGIAEKGEQAISKQNPTGYMTEALRETARQNPKRIALEQWLWSDTEGINLKWISELLGNTTSA